MITSISGKIGSGKDTFARLLQYHSSPHIYGEIKLRHYLQKCETCDNLSPIQIKKFAANVKVITALLIGCTVQDLENEEFKNKILPKEWDKYGVFTDSNLSMDEYEYFVTEKEAILFCDEKYLDYSRIVKVQMTPRLLMQLVGNDFGRDMVHPNLWVMTLMNEYKEGCDCKGLYQANEPLDKNCKKTSHLIRQKKSSNHCLLISLIGLLLRSLIINIQLI